MAEHIDVRAFRDFTDILGLIERDLVDELEAGLLEAGEVVADEARRLAPRRSGRLAGSIRVQAIPGGARVTATARGTGGYRYPGRIEFDPGMGPHPFLYPAADRKRGEAGDLIEKHITTMIDRYWRART